MMRSTPTQPGNYLGDDPDLTAELGQRLAATAQTGQGLITNYLFYGQRRATEQQLTDRQDRGDQHRQQRTAGTTRTGDGYQVRQAAQRTRDDLNRAPAPPPTDSTVSDGQAHTARRTFRIVHPHEAGRNTGVVVPAADPADQQPALEDHLAVDTLAADPNKRDPLAADPGTPVVPRPVTLDHQGPARRH